MKKMALVVLIVGMSIVILKTKTAISADMNSEIPAMREGVVVIPEDDLALLLASILKDDRYR